MNVADMTITTVNNKSSRPVYWCEEEEEYTKLVFLCVYIHMCVYSLVGWSMIDYWQDSWLNSPKLNIHGPTWFPLL